MPETSIIKIGRIYLITNLINNKKYIGITTRTVEKRFKEHIRTSNNEKYSFLINKSIKKYGKENFKIELVKELYDTTENELLFEESFYINKYNTLIDNGCGYNLLKYDDGHLIFSKDMRKRMSESHKGEKNYNFGKHYTEEEKIKQSLSHIGKQIGKDNPFFGKTHTKETKELISSIHKGKITSKESRKKMSISQKLRFENVNNCFNIDFTTRKFKNILTGEEFVGLRRNFRRKYDLKKCSVNALINGRLKILKGWILVEA